MLVIASIDQFDLVFIYPHTRTQNQRPDQNTYISELVFCISYAAHKQQHTNTVQLTVDQIVKINEDIGISRF